MTGSFRKPEVGAIDTIDVVDPLTIRLNLKAPFSPLIAQLTDRAGMMVSPKAAKEAGDKFGLKPVCAGPYKFVERVQQDRIVVEKFADYWNKDNVHIDRIVYLPIVDSTVRLASLKSGGLELIERLLATDIKDVRANPKLKLSTALELGYQGMDLNLANGEKAKNPLGAERQGPAGAQLRDRPRSADAGCVQRRIRARQPMGQSGASVFPEEFPGHQARCRQSQGADQGSRRHDTVRCRFPGPEGRRNAGGRGSHPGDGGGSRHQHENPRHRIRDLAQASRDRRIPGLSSGLERPHRSRRQYSISSTSARRRRTMPAIATRTSTSCSIRARTTSDPPSARRSTKSSPRSSSTTIRSFISIIAAC